MLPVDPVEGASTVGRLLLPRRVLVVSGLIALLTFVAGVATALAPDLPEPTPAAIVMPAWLLAALFVVAQGFVLNVQLMREARSIFLSEVPFALALAFVSPNTFLLTRTAAALVTYAGQRRQYRQPAKLAFNLMLSIAETAVGLTVFRAVLWGAETTGPRAWLAIDVANVAASCLAALCVAWVIQQIEGSPSLRELAGLLPLCALQSATVSTVGVVCVIALTASRWAALPLAALCFAVLTAYRAYSSLSSKHIGLERLYRFSQVVSSTPEMHEALTSVLEQAKDLLHAERAFVTFLPGAGSAADAGAGAEENHEVALARNGVLQRGPATLLGSHARWLTTRLLGDDASVLLPRKLRDSPGRSWLDSCGLREAILVPLRGSAGVVAILGVADRLGEARGFDRDDVRLLETVASHAAIALQNSRLVDQLRHESLHDGLTKLPNRVCFQRELDNRLAALPAATALAVGVLDLDNFKDINDTLGHALGDELLRELAVRLTATAGGRAVIARLGGDEFAVLLDDTDEARAVQFAKQLVNCLHAPLDLGGVEVEIGGSLGLALSCTSGLQRSTLLKHADMAMYAAKQAGYDVRVYDTGLDTSAPSRLAMVGHLRQTIAAGGLEVHVQPKASLETGEVTGTEALVRWSDAERGPVAPEEFIPLSERSGLIRPLTDFVLRTAIEACAGWQLDLPDVGIAVNLSFKSLADDRLVEQVARLLERYSLPSRLLTLEVTESSIMSEPAKSLPLLHRLRDLGVVLSIDDFGTGYSSLSHLRQLPVSELKIDKSFVCDALTDSDDLAVARSIVDLGRSLGLHVVAEGLEERASWHQMRQLGCETGQGFLISRPMPAREFVRWSQSYRRPAALRSG